LPNTPIVADLHQRWQAGYSPVAARRREDENAVGQLGAKAVHWLLGDCVYRTAQRNGRSVALYDSEESLWGQIQPDDPALEALRSRSLPAATTVYAPLGSRHHVDHRIVRDGGLWLKTQNPALHLIFYEEYPYEVDAIMELEQALAFFSPQAMQLDPRPISETAVAAKIRAIACYESQISTFWAGIEEMAAKTRRSMIEAGEGVPVERFWQLVE
jgi:LmbE family N-acetylglucosaminyl deacetylase